MASNALNIYDPATLPIQTAMDAPKTEGEKIKAALPGLLGNPQVGSSDPVLVNPRSAAEQSVLRSATTRSNNPAPTASIGTNLTMGNIANAVMNVPTQGAGQPPAQVTPEDVSAEVAQRFQAQPKAEKPVRGLMGDTGANANTPDYANMWWEIAPETSQFVGGWSRTFENPYTGQRGPDTLLGENAQIMGLKPTNGQTNRDYDRAYQAGLLAGR